MTKRGNFTVQDIIDEGPESVSSVGIQNYYANLAQGKENERVTEEQREADVISLMATMLWPVTSVGADANRTKQAVKLARDIRREAMNGED